MDLVPIEEETTKPDTVPSTDAESKDKSRTAVTIDSERQQRIGLTTATIANGPAKIAIRAAGRVAFDPELAVAQREYLEARRSGDSSIAEAARRRLILMGMDESQIKELGHRGKSDESLTLPKNTAWIYATVYERELPFVKISQTANIELSDGASLGSGTIRAIDPVIDPETRTVRVRIEIPNAEGRLRPNAFVNAIIQNDLGEKLLVPKSAIIDTGERKIAFLVHNGGHFMPREVSLGAELKDSYVVEGGLSSGDVVATGALFLIDSESQLKAATGAQTGHKHD